MWQSLHFWGRFVLRHKKEGKITELYSACLCNARPCTHTRWSHLNFNLWIHMINLFTLQKYQQGHKQRLASRSEEWVQTGKHPHEKFIFQAEWEGSRWSVIKKDMKSNKFRTDLNNKTHSPVSYCVQQQQENCSVLRCLRPKYKAERPTCRTFWGFVFKVPVPNLT